MKPFDVRVTFGGEASEIFGRRLPESSGCTVGGHPLGRAIVTFFIWIKVM